MTTSGGVPKTILLKANFLADKLNHSVYLLCDEQYKNTPLFFEKNDRVHIHYISMKSKMFKKTLENYLCSQSFDITIGIALSDSVFNDLYKINDGSKKIMEFRTSYKYVYGFSNWRYDLKNWFKDKKRFLKFIHTARKYDAFVCLSEGDKKFFKKYINRVFSIGNPIDVIALPNPKYESKKVIAVGRLEPVKQFSRLIDMWVKIANDFPDWQLNIYGEGPLKEELERKIYRLNMEKTIFLKGKNPDILQQMLNHSILVLTSQYEGFGNVLLEASMCKIPIVTFNSGFGIKEILSKSNGGYLIPLNNEKIFVQQLSKLMKSKDKRSEMGKKGENVLQYYNIEKVMKQWDSLFHKLIQ